ncbi:hypothetical protein GWI33_018477 [Rhynchophorus ferrugineus]|uniref:Uncharacterized protein n=1 Tax=Rhynchophorus ferrugineus TaxID=354439 RepID=A0A834I799_RHYFE|nr:hypothetical protein GWI33_018477 [Rhynchophorus ferrugineus]
MLGLRFDIKGFPCEKEQFEYRTTSPGHYLNLDAMDIQLRLAVLSTSHYHMQTPRSEVTVSGYVDGLSLNPRLINTKELRDWIPSIN